MYKFSHIFDKQIDIKLLPFAKWLISEIFMTFTKKHKTRDDVTQGLSNKISV
jgi:hypothetical protein